MPETHLEERKPFKIRACQAITWTSRKLPASCGTELWPLFPRRCPNIATLHISNGLFQKTYLLDFERNWDNVKFVKVRLMSKDTGRILADMFDCPLAEGHGNENMTEALLPAKHDIACLSLSAADSAWSNLLGKWFRNENLMKPKMRCKHETARLYLRAKGSGSLFFGVQ